MTERTEAVLSLDELLAADKVDLPRVAQLFDRMPHEERLQITRGLGAREQGALWRAAEGSAITLEQLVPADVPANSTVRHYGRNTLPAFTLFEKRFYRASDGSVAGANFQVFAWVTGPGYFSAAPSEGGRELVLDSTRLPSSAPQGWPKITPNERGFSRFVYGFLTDRLRRVSSHVTIGMPERRGKPLGSWFILCREELAGAR